MTTQRDDARPRGRRSWLFRSVTVPLRRIDVLMLTVLAILFGAASMQFWGLCR